MKNTTYIFSIITLVFLTSCNPEKIKETLDEIDIYFGFKEREPTEEEIKEETPKEDRHGLYEFHYASGMLMSEVNYEYGQKHGWAKDYYEDGTLHAEYNYEHDKLNGPFKWYHENGNIYKEVNYVDHKMDGTLKLYHKSGKLRYECPYKEDMPGIGAKFYNTAEQYLDKYDMKINVRVQDERATKNKLVLLLDMGDYDERRVKKIQFYMGELIDGQYFRDISLLPLASEDDVGELVVPVPKGLSVDKNISIVAYMEVNEEVMIVQRYYHLRM